MRFLNGLRNIGIHDNLTKEQAREVVTINAVNTGALIILFLLIAINLSSAKYVPAILETITIFLGTIPVYYLHHNKSYYTAKILLFGYITVSVAIIAIYAVFTFRFVNTEIILVALALSTIVYFNGAAKKIGFFGLMFTFYGIITFKYYYWQHKTLSEFVFECINTAVMFYASYLFINTFKLYFLDYEQQIMQNNKKLIQHNEEKDKLFSIIAHDLRSPLGSLNQILAMLAEGQLSKEEFDVLVSKISKNANRSSELLDNLLQWASSQMKGFKVLKKRINIQALIQEKIESMQQVAAQKNIEIVNNSPEEIFALADPNMISIVLRNLLSNAIKFSYKGSVIVVGSAKENDKIKVWVKDDGAGVAAEEMPALFDNIAYTKPGTDNEKGTGLGLVLCKEFIEKNDGQIGVESSIGKGSIFYFTLPMA